MIKGNSLVLRQRLSLATAQQLARDPAYADLEVLDLWSNRLSPRALAVLLKQPPPGLRELQLVDNKLGPEGASFLAGVLPALPRLERLNLQHNQLGVAGLAQLLGARLDTLRWLGLRENQLGPEGAALLVERAPPALEALHIGANDLGDAGMAALAPLLTRLVELSCGDNRLRTDAMAAIAGAERLTTLDIERNLCGPEGARALAGTRAALHNLDMYYNNIGPEGAEALFGGREHPELQRLHLRANQLGDAGAIAFARGSMPRLEVLNLEDNAIGPAGAEALARSPVLARLTQLHLHSNKFGAAGVGALITSPRLPRSTRTEVFKVLQHYIPDEQLAELAADRGVELRRDRLETLLAVADASAP